MSEPLRPSTTCYSDHHPCADPFDSDSSDSGHVEYSEGTIAILAAPRRRSTLSRWTDTARNTTKVAKRKLSKVISFRRKDSTNEQDEDSSTAIKALRMSPDRVSRIHVSGAELASHDPQQQPSMCRDEQREDHLPIITHHQLDNPPPYEAYRDSWPLGRTIHNAPSESDIPQTSLQESVDFYSKRARPSPEEMPHECFMQNSTLWVRAAARLERFAGDPELVESRFDRIYEEML